MSSVALIGVGVMGETLLAGLLKAGWDVGDVIVAESRPQRHAEIRARYGVGVVTAVDAVRRADIVLLVVKPQDLHGVLDEIRGDLRPGALVISVVAGIRTESIEASLPAGTPVVRVMPNTPSRIFEGMAAICPGAQATKAHLDIVTGIIAAVGKVVVVPEKHLDAVTAVSGSGPAYVFLVVEAMIEASVLLGLPRDLATTLTIQTVLGSARLLDETREHPTVLREQVTSPGGTTAAALRQLEDHRVRAAFTSAMEAARNRSRELSAG